MTAAQGDLLHTVGGETITPTRRMVGHLIVYLSAAWFLISFLWQALRVSGMLSFGFDNWRPVLYAYAIWGVALCVSRVLIYGESGKKALFVLPATLFVVSMVVFPLLFAIWVGFSDWNLASTTGRQFNGLDNIKHMLTDPFYGNALYNMIIFCLAIVVEYAIAFGLALLLNQEIVARKFWRVVFLVPLMLSPVALSWMVGKSMLENRFGPVARILRWMGWQNPSFFGDPITAKLSIMIMDAWTYIPFMMIMLLAGLQSLNKEVLEAAEVDGANKWQQFWQVVFPLMLPVSITAVLIRIIFKLKLADIIITVTAGGPGGATDSVTSFIYREYRDRSNVGYGTLLALVYLVIIVIFMTALLKITDRIVNRMTGRLLMATIATMAEKDPQRLRWWVMRFVVYGLLVIWAAVCIFPIFWTISTSFKIAADVMKGNMIPWWGYTPNWLGWRSLGLSPDTIFELSTVREEFMRRLLNSVAISIISSVMAVILGSLAAYGLSRFSYKFGFMRNSDISFFFLSQLIMPPVVLALPFLVLYRELALLDTYIGMIAVYTLMVLPIVVWIMRDQFAAIPVELEEAALVDGLSIWGAFFRIIVPLVLPGMVAAFILSLILCWNEYFFAALLTSKNTNTLPVMIASQTGSQGISWWSMAALSTAGILPLVFVGVFLEKHIIAGMTAGAVK